MKKLIIAAAVAIVGIAANAASVSWSMSWAYSDNDGSDDTYNNGMSGTYWIVALGDSATSDISVSDAGDITVGTGATVQSTGSFTSDAAGSLNFTAAGDKFAMVIFNSTYQRYGVSDAATITGYSETPPTPADPIAFSNISDGGWDMMFADQVATSSVPEPTSGLLLLLGVAGLALKRKHA